MGKQAKGRKPKQFTMWAVPHSRIDGRGALSIHSAGALAVFSSRALADEFNGEAVIPAEPVKVRVTIELSGSPKGGE